MWLWSSKRFKAFQVFLVLHWIWNNLILIYYIKITAWSVQIRSYFWSVFSYIRIEYRKIRTRNNSVFGHFHAVNGTVNLFTYLNLHFQDQNEAELDSPALFWFLSSSLCYNSHLKNDEKESKLSKNILSFLLIAFFYDFGPVNLKQSDPYFRHYHGIHQGSNSKYTEHIISSYYDKF